MNTGFKVCKTLMALKLHFTSKKYNFFDYGGEVTIKPETFSMRNDKYLCEDV